MIRIGKFADLFGISIKTIRLYEEKRKLVSVGKNDFC